jgi:hypothetical protein
MDEPQFDSNTMRDVSIPIVDLGREILILSAVLLIGSGIPYLLIWGFPVSWGFSLSETLLTFLVLAVLAIAHEATHAIGWIIFGPVPPNSIRFGVDLKTLSPYAHARVPMKATGYRIGAALPGIITGILPTLVGTVIGNGWLTFLGAFMVMGAVGDILILWAIRDVDGNARVLDHPSNVGCYVFIE